MEMTLGYKLNGFTLVQKRDVEELGGSFCQFVHDKTGAELCWVDNKESNKLFSIAFKTLPEDDTGVFHILEHSVLCGSDKFPVKEPFVDLLKGSMQTFLNAITFGDKTMYPVSSRNEQDFLNLTEVYLDAVFAPLLLSNPNIFYQEGWHTELNDGVPSYKGVVFNEMKGATSGVDRAIFSAAEQAIFPDNCYRFESGGDPEAIVDLSYEQYCSFYRRFYHPSNARIWLDGSVPLERTFALIDSYLSRYERSEEKHDIPMQTPKKGEKVMEYAVAQGQAENKAVLGWGKILCSYEDRVTTMAASVLCSYLSDSNEAPLKKAILSKGLGEDLDMEAEDGLQQNLFFLCVRNTSPDKEEAIKATVRETVEQLIKEGLDKEALTASLNPKVFALREQKEPAGLIRNINALSAWLYGGDPLSYIIHDEVIASVRRMIDNGEMEKLLSFMLLEEDTLCSIKILPSETLEQEKKDKEEVRLKKEQASRSPEQEKALTELNEKLVAWQSTPDTEEKKATLPVLAISEIGEEMDFTETAESTVEGVKLWYHPLPCHGIQYNNLYFSLSDKSIKELSYLSLLPELLGNLPTKSHENVLELQQLVKSYIGNLDFSLSAEAPKGERKLSCPMLTVKVSLLEENAQKAAALVNEILTETEFTNKEAVKNVLLQKYEISKQQAMGGGHALAMSAANASLTASGAVRDAFGGHTGLMTLKELVDSFDEKYPMLAELYEKVLAESICKSRMTLSLSSDKPVEAAPWVNFPTGTAIAPLSAYVTELPYRYGIIIPMPVGFSSQTLYTGQNGALNVASQIMSYDYLWNVVRVQGGAYGTGLRKGGEMLLTYSFRDPTPAKSVAVNKTLGEALENWCKGSESVDKYIISTVAEPLMSNASKATLADSYCFRGVTKDDLLKQREQMLSVSKESLPELIPVLNELGEKGPFCIVGPAAAMEGVEGIVTREL